LAIKGIQLKKETWGRPGHRVPGSQEKGESVSERKRKTPIPHAVLANLGEKNQKRSSAKNSKNDLKKRTLRIGEKTLARRLPRIEGKQKGSRQHARLKRKEGGRVGRG